MKYFIDRLREPSTWSGIGLFATMFGVPPGTLGLVQQLVMGAAGIATILMKEGAAPVPVKITPAQEVSGP